MALALNRTPSQRVDYAHPTAVCRVHTCVRCQASVTSSQPCSFVPSLARACPPCSTQEQVVSHLPVSRTPWGAALARTRRI